MTRQKGFDVVVEELHQLLQKDIQIVLLGTGDPGFENAFAWFGQAYPDKLSANITFDVQLAQEIYAASDVFLMPSRFEPCGLSQMMAMRYGTLPLVHEVGGLEIRSNRIMLLMEVEQALASIICLAIGLTGQLMKPWLSTTMTNRLGMVCKSKL